MLCAMLLTACGAVSEAEEAIDQIGTVSLESQGKIEAAEALYNALSDSQRKRVENRFALSTARKEYDRMFHAVETARRAILAIGEVTPDSLDGLQKARDAYEVLKADNLTDYIPEEYNLLLMAEAEYAQLRYEEGCALLEDKLYGDAHRVFSSILEDYPGCAIAASLAEGDTQALCALAQQQLWAGKLEDAYYALREITENYGSSDSVEALQTQLQQRLDAKRPYNGQVFTNTAGWGYGEFSVKADHQDACIKLESRDDPTKYILFYARAGQEAKVNVKDGRYIAKYATGDQWFDQNVLFGKDTAYTRAEDVMDLTTTYEGGYVYYQAISITLYSVIGGDLETSDIPASQF